MNQSNPLTQIIKELPFIMVGVDHLEEEIELLLKDADNAVLTHTGSCAVISGDSGAGKTMLLKKMVDRFNNVYKGENECCNAVFIRTPSDMNPLDLLREILSCFGEPGEIKGTAYEMRRRIITQIENKNIKMIVFDEFQQVVEKFGEKSVRQYADYLKELMDKHGIFMLFAGTPRVEQILDANEQFASRCTRVVRKSLMSVNTPDAYSTFASYLTTLQDVHGIQGVDLSNESIVLPMQATTKGDLRVITRMLINACQQAKSKGRSKLTRDDFQQSWVSPRMSGRKEVVNPFRRQLSVLRKDLGVNYEI